LASSSVSPASAALCSALRGRARAQGRKTGGHEARERGRMGVGQMQRGAALR
jgi:hypothetical protein